MAKGNIFINRKVMACSISILIVLIGFISLKTLPIEQYPDIAPPTVIVTTSYSGADAGTVMNSVVMPLEEAINGVEGMTYITSEASSNGTVTIFVYFEQGYDPDMATVNVQNRVSRTMSKMPAEVSKVGVTVDKRQNSILQIAGMYSENDKFDSEFITNYIDINLKPRLLRINGVGNVQLLGDTYSLRVWMKPDRMAEYSLQPSDVFQALNNQNLVAAAGLLGEQSDNAYQYNMEYKGRLQEISEFERIVLKTTQDGNVLHLEDVAEVELGSVAYNYTSKMNGHNGVSFIINQAAGANATLVNQQIEELYRDVEKQLPPGLKFQVLETSNDFLFAAIDSVVETLIIAILLVILVVYFFLHDFKSTLIPTISIIVSLLGTFAIVKLAGFSLNILTLFALVLAIGTVVDDAIVVVEAVMVKLENGYKDSHKAARDAMSEVSVAVFSCTLVFMAVFIPVTFMPGTSGKFFTQFGITIASAVGLSCVNAMSLCPALCAILMHAKQEGGKERKGLNYYTKVAYEASYNALLGKYRTVLPKFLNHAKLAWTLLAVTVVLMAFFMKSLPSGLVPQEDQGCVMVNVMGPAGATLNETNALVSKIEERINDIPEIEAWTKISGFGIISGESTSYGTLIIRLKNWDERKKKSQSINSIMARISASCEDIKEASIMPFQMPQIPGYGTSNAIELVLQDRQGGTMTEFNTHANEFLSKLQQRPEVGMAMSTYSESFPKYTVDIDATRCDRAGISTQEVLNVLGAYCGGAYVGDFNKFGKVYRVMASAAPEYRLDPSSLNNIYIKVKGQMAPISQFVKLTKSVGPASYTRFNLYQSIKCQVSAAEGYSDGQVQQAISEVADEMLPYGYGYEYGGMSRELAKNANSNMTGVIYIICIFLIYLILGCLYESWFIPFSVLLSVPFGLMGSFMLSKFCGMENNIYLQTGVIMLIGLLAKTAILITEFAVQKHAQGMGIRESALAAAEDRLRPIIMTVFCMIAGMIPLIIEGGAGANGNRALAIGVVGGMFVGTIALLFVVPAFYMIFQKLHDKYQKVAKEEE